MVKFQVYSHYPDNLNLNFIISFFSNFFNETYLKGTSYHQFLIALKFIWNILKYHAIKSSK